MNGNQITGGRVGCAGEYIASDDLMILVSIHIQSELKKQSRVKFWGCTRKQ